MAETFTFEEALGKPKGSFSFEEAAGIENQKLSPALPAIPDELIYSELAPRRTVVSTVTGLPIPDPTQIKQLSRPEIRTGLQRQFENITRETTPEKLIAQGQLGLKRGLEVDIPTQAAATGLGISKMFPSPMMTPSQVYGPELTKQFGLRTEPEATPSQKYFRETLDGLNYEANKFNALSTGIGGGSSAYDIGGTATSMLPIIPAAMVGGLPLSALASGVQSASANYNDAINAYKQQGKNQNEAEQKAALPAMIGGLVTALVTAGFGKTGVEAEFTRKGFVPFLKDAAKAFGFEGLEEGTDQEWQSVISSLSYRPDLTTEQALKETLFAAAAGGLLTVPSSGISGALLNIQKETGTEKTKVEPVIKRPQQQAELQVAEVPPLTPENKHNVEPTINGISVFKQYPDAVLTIDPSENPTGMKWVSSTDDGRFVWIPKTEEPQPTAPAVNQPLPAELKVEQPSSVPETEMTVYRGTSKSNPFNASETDWWTTSKDVAESYATDIMGYEDPVVIEAKVNVKDLPVHDIRKLTEEQLNALNPDQFGNPQNVGVYRNSDDSLINVRHTVVNAPKTAATIPAEVIENNGIKLPSGYVKEGNQYVYKPTQPAAEAKVAVAPILGKEVTEHGKEMQGKEAVVPTEPQPAVEPAKPAAVPSPPSAAVKEPWEMTRADLIRQQFSDPKTADEFVKRLDEWDSLPSSKQRPYMQDRYPDYAYAARMTGVTADGITQAVARIPRHRGQVEQALREGKPVPPEVLKDYPDLQQKPQPPQPKGEPNAESVLDTPAKVDVQKRYRELKDWYNSLDNDATRDQWRYVSDIISLRKNPTEATERAKRLFNPSPELEAKASELARLEEIVNPDWVEFLRTQDWEKFYKKHYRPSGEGAKGEPISRPRRVDERVKQAIKDARENGASPEFRALFTGVDPELVGTTNPKVRAFAKTLGLEWTDFKKQEVSNAESLRSSEKQPSETGQAVEESQANRGGVVEQTPPVKPQPVEQGGTKNVSGEVNPAVEYEKSNVKWATYATDVVEPLRKALNAAEKVVRDMWIDERRTQSTKAKEKITLKALFEKYGVKNKSEFNELYVQKEKLKQEADKRLKDSEAELEKLKISRDKALEAWRNLKQPTAAEKVDVALKKLKVQAGGLQLFGVVPHVWNAAVDIVRLAVKGGMAVADAVKKGLDYIRANQKEKWDEQAATDALNQAASTEGMVSDTTTQLPTQSKFFTGTYGEDTWNAAEQRAQSWLSDKTPDEALNALTLKAGGDNSVVIDDDAFAQAIKLLMRTFYQQQQDAKTDFEKTDAMESLLRLAELAKSQATTAAQRLNIQKVFNENEYMVPYLVYIGAAKKSWLDKIGIKEPVGEVESFVQTSNQDAAKQVSDEVNAVAEGRTTTKTKQLFNSPEKLFRLMTKLVKAGGINWSTLFLDNSRASQEQQRKHLFDQIKNHPDLQELSESEKIQLEQALFTAWQRARLQVMQSQLSRLIKIPRATPEGMAALAKEIYPELVRQANAGTLDTAWFRDWIANKFGLPTVRAEVAAKLFDLGQKAQALKYQTQKNKVYQEMIRLLEDESKLNWNTIFQESWYASVLARLGTWENVTIGNVVSGIYMNFAAAADRLARGDLKGSINTLALFYYSLWEGADMAQYIIRTGDLSVLPWYQERIGKMLSGDKKMRMEMLERIKRKGGFAGKTLGQLAYSKRILIALDALASVGMTDSMVYYEALSAKDKKAADLMMRRFDKNSKAQAYKQARALLGPEAPRQQVRALMHDIMREGINKEYVDFARYSAQLVAANAVPRGIFGYLYRTVANWNFWIKAPLGLAFFRATMNLMQHAYNNIPALGATTYLQGKAGKLPANNPLHKFGIDMSTGQMRIALLEQAISLSMMLGLGVYLLSGDPDEDKEIDVEGSWDGLTPNQKKYLRETLKRYPYSIRIGDIRISYRNLPIAPMLAALGKTRDGQKYRDEQWDEKSWVDKTITAWASGIAYMKDISSIAGVAQALGFGAYDTTDRDTTTINRYAADTLGRAAGGFAPSLTKELDQILDPRRYEPDKKDVFGQWIQYFPFIRREAGKPALNTFGQEIMTRTGPLKSWITQDQQGRFYDVMGLKASQGIFPPDTGKGHVLFDPITKERRKMTDFEERLYAREFGRMKMIMLNDNLNDFLHMTNEEAKKWYEGKEWNALRLKAKTEVESRLK